MHPIFMALTITLLTSGIAGGIWRGRRGRHSGTRMAIAAGLANCAGIVTAGAMLQHCIVVPLERALGSSKPYADTTVFHIGGFAYDFRIYSLLFMGIAYIWQAVKMIRASRGVAAGRTDAAGEAARAAALLTMFSVPLYPLQPASIVLSVFTVPALVAVVYASRSRTADSGLLARLDAPPAAATL